MVTLVSEIDDKVSMDAARWAVKAVIAEYASLMEAFSPADPSEGLTLLVLRPPRAAAERRLVGLAFPPKDVFEVAMLVNLLGGMDEPEGHIALCRLLPLEPGVYAYVLFLIRYNREEGLVIEDMEASDGEKLEGVIGERISLEDVEWFFQSTGDAKVDA